jgi:phosphoenolpyruvate synthase/pyruvate phosphate dikinase
MHEQDASRDDQSLSARPGLVVDLGPAEAASVADLGGKGANLARLAGIEGIHVPPGCCVTTAAYRRALAAAPIEADLERLEQLEPQDRDAIREVSGRLREAIEALPVPEEVERSLAAAIERLGAGSPYAVRSSATAEDLPSASFAGQHDSFLDVVGVPAVLHHVRRCWASLFTERAVAYRLRHGLEQRSSAMAVVVQQMVRPAASGVLFTADPVSGNRTVAVLEAVSGLGDALVSGTVDPDVYRVRDARIVERTLEHGAPLSDEQVVELVEIGRRLESHFGTSQDVEWCVDDRGVHVVQSRPITTLFPIPRADDDAFRVYVSVGHQQMMTEPMTPLGISIWQMTSRAPMRSAGGRLFVEVTAMLSVPATRATTLENLGRSDPRIRDALETVLERGLLPLAADATSEPRLAGESAPGLIEADSAIVAELIEENRASVDGLHEAIAGTTGTALLDVIEADLAVLQGLLSEPKNQQALLAGFQPRWWLDEHLDEWLGERNAADVLCLAAPDNVTAEMGLALLDVADAIRPHPAAVAVLRESGGDDVLDRLAEVQGGLPARAAIADYLARYGMRCPGEIDVGRPRWSERPSALVPMILANVDNFEPGESGRRVARGRTQAGEKAQELLQRLRALPDGERKAEQTQQMIDRLRTYTGYREYPKYGMVRRYFAYRRALLEEAERWVDAGVLDEADDLFFLTFEELREVARTGRADRDVIARRRRDFRVFAELRPARVLTSEGEALDGAHRREDVPDGALVGVAVSGDVVEGPARVVFDVAEADLAPGDILVTPHTDPSWSPLFVAIAGLVTEVGGLMTHGAVVAREYGLTAVVSVDHATTRIRDGQRIRVDGTRGIVEILDEDGSPTR